MLPHLTLTMFHFIKRNALMNEFKNRMNKYMEDDRQIVNRQRQIEDEMFVSKATSLFWAQFVDKLAFVYLCNVKHFHLVDFCYYLVSSEESPGRFSIPKKGTWKMVNTCDTAAPRFFLTWGRLNVIYNSTTLDDARKS